MVSSSILTPLTACCWACSVFTMSSVEDALLVAVEARGGDAVDHGTVGVVDRLAVQNGLTDVSGIGQSEGIAVVVGAAVLGGGDELRVALQEGIHGDILRRRTLEKGIDPQSRQDIAGILAE